MSKNFLEVIRENSLVFQLNNALVYMFSHIQNETLKNGVFGSGQARVHFMSTPRWTSFKAFSIPHRASFKCVSHHVILNMSGMGLLQTLLNLQTTPHCFMIYCKRTKECFPNPNPS